MKKVTLGSSNPITVFTIGYEGLDLGEFFDILNAHKIEILVDVRELPLSRKRGFSKRSLSASCTEYGLEYEHFQLLGAPRDVRHALRENNDWDQYCYQYLNHLDKNDSTLRELLEVAQGNKICLMCFEADYSVCHRSLITDRLES
jgi:uncharacterized protein (DUF488 family)